MTMMSDWKDWGGGVVIVIMSSILIGSSNLLIGSSASFASLDGTCVHLRYQGIFRNVRRYQEQQ